MMAELSEVTLRVCRDLIASHTVTIGQPNARQIASQCFLALDEVNAALLAPAPEPKESDQ